MYYFSGTLFKQDLGQVTNSLPYINSENITTQTIINNLKIQPITGQDTLVPKLSNETLESLVKIDFTVQTETFVKPMTD